MTRSAETDIGTRVLLFLRLARFPSSSPVLRSRCFGWARIAQLRANKSFPPFTWHYALAHAVPYKCERRRRARAQHVTRRILCEAQSPAHMDSPCQETKQQVLATCALLTLHTSWLFRKPPGHSIQKDKSRRSQSHPPGQTKPFPPLRGCRRP